MTLYFLKELELDEGRRVQKREEKCKKDFKLEGSAVKGIFEWSWMKAEKRRKCKTKSKKFRKKRNTAEAFENLVEINLLEFQKA